MLSTLPLPLTVGFAGLLVLLVLGSVAAIVLPRIKPGKWDDLVPRMRSWWVICLLVGGALILGWQVFTILFAFISFIGIFVARLKMTDLVRVMTLRQMTRCLNLALKPNLALNLHLALKLLTWLQF